MTEQDQKQLGSIDIEKPKKLSLAAPAEIMRPFYVEGSELTEFVDTGNEDFCEYPDYA